MSEKEETRLLMMAALDGELESEERAELDRRLATDPALRAEWQDMNRLKELVVMSTIKSPPEEQWDKYWHSVYNKIERGLGWILSSLGATVLLCYGLYYAMEALLADSSIPGLVKWAIFALGAGAILLLVSVVREKLFTHRNDPFKEVER